MNRQDAEALVTRFMKPVYGFALKRCRSAQDAEDLTQEIVLRAFHAILLRDDIASPDSFIWTIAHHTLSNYYRSAEKIRFACIDDHADRLAAPDDSADADMQETIARMRQEIAYLSRMQRRIVIAYYFENRRQSEIAQELGVPLGTVKWYLFDARKELKRGMTKMRTPTQLQFNPIKFDGFSISGSVGTKNPDDFFRSALSQNIACCVRDTAKTVNEIADALGVSPVYVESEADYLEEYGFLRREKDRYIANFTISEPSAALLTLQCRMYRRAAGLFAPALFDALTSSGILDDPDILCGQTDTPVSATADAPRDHNYLLWTLIPYIAALSGDHLREKSISFDDVATYRPDGAHNIIHASIADPRLELPEDYVPLGGWNGPMWNECGGRILWEIDSQWSNRTTRRGFMIAEDSQRVLTLFAREKTERLSRDEYAWLAERGYVKTNGDYDGCFKAAWQIVILGSEDVQNRLIALGDAIKERLHDEFESLKRPFTEAALAAVPAHLRRQAAYGHQYIFHSDGLFLLHCITALVESGRLRLPTEEQRKSLTSIISFPR